MRFSHHPVIAKKAALTLFYHRCKIQLTVDWPGFFLLEEEKNEVLCLYIGMMAIFHIFPCMVKCNSIKRLEFE